MTTYNIEKMRVVRTSGKTADNNPDRFATVFGIFHDEAGHKMSFTSKTITFDQARDLGTVIDQTNGILTLQGGTKGRTAYASVSQVDLEAELEALRAE